MADMNIMAGTGIALREFWNLGAVVSALERARANLRRYRASVLKSAVEGRLTATLRNANKANPDIEPASELRERRQRWEQQQLATYESKGKKPPKNWQSKYKEPAAPDTANLPELPTGWCWVTVDQLTEFVTSGSRGWAKYYSDEGSTFIRAQDIKTDALKLETIAHVNPPNSAEGRRTQTKHLDLLVTITGANVTKTAIEEFGLEDAYFSQHVALVRPVDTKLTRFMHLFIVCPAHGRRRLEKDAYGAGKPGLNLDNIRTLAVPVAPIAEAEVIVNIAATSLDSSKRVEASALSNEIRSNRLRQAILKNAFEGMLTSQQLNTTTGRQENER